MRSLPPLVVALGLVGLIGGCGVEEVKPDGASGPDAEKTGATELFLDKLTDDFVSVEAGDATDWKYFKIREKGILTLTVYWDNKDIRSIIDVRDRFGALLDTRRHSSELEKDVLELRVEPGTHFVRLFTEKGESVYTIEAVFQQFDHSPTDDFRPTAVGGDLLGDPLAGDDARPEPRRTRRARRSRARKPVQASPSGPTVSARIVRILPGRRGTELTLNRGTEHGVNKGDSGYVLDDDGKRLDGSDFVIESAEARVSTASTPLQKKSIAHHRRVRVRTR